MANFMLFGEREDWLFSLLFDSSHPFNRDMSIVSRGTTKNVNFWLILTTFAQKCQPVALSDLTLGWTSVSVQLRD